MTEICPHCHAGALCQRPVTYAAWHTLKDSRDEQFVLVPGVPAWLCDVCGAKFLDAEAMAWLAPLLGPVADPDEAIRLAFARRERAGPSFDGDLDRRRAQ